MMHFRRIKENKGEYMSLLLLADESEHMIAKYLERGEMYILEDFDAVVGEIVVTDEGEGILEIKNIAVDPQYSAKGYGRALIDYIEKEYRGRFSIIRVGTGESPSTVPFYEKCGFRYSYRIKNFFLDNYDHLIYEDGILLKDMVYFVKELS